MEVSEAVVNIYANFAQRLVDGLEHYNPMDINPR